jgi:hypothetical protein
MERLWQWIQRRRAEREQRREALVMTRLMLSPGVLEQYKQRLAEDDWTARREGER